MDVTTGGGGGGAGGGGGGNAGGGDTGGLGVLTEGPAGVVGTGRCRVNRPALPKSSVDRRTVASARPSGGVSVPRPRVGSDIAAFQSTTRDEAEVPEHGKDQALVARVCGGTR